MRKARGSIRTKLIVCIMVVVLMVIVVLAFSLRNVSYIINEYEKIQSLSLVLNDFYNNINNAKSKYSSYFFSADQNDYNGYTLYLGNARDCLGQLIKGATSNEIVFKYRLLSNMVDSFEMAVEESLQYPDFSLSSEAYDKYNDATSIINLINLQFNSYFELQTEAIRENAERVESTFVSFKNWMIVLSAVTAVTAIAFLVYLSRSITKPVMDLAKTAKQISLNKFDVDTVKVRSHDELAILADAFNEMTASIRYYIGEMEKTTEIKERLAEEEMANLKMQNLIKESQLKALQDKINPHFLFNTLNIVYQSAFIENAETTMELLYATTKMLRYALDRIDRPVTIAEELAQIENYMFISKQRFGDRINFEIEVRDIEQQEEVLMPALIIQPIIENSISHGLSQKKADGKICLECCVEDERLKIAVSDNGIGMDEAIIEKIMSGDYIESGSMALRNVKMRLELFYGESNLMSIHSTAGQGTTVEMSLPMKARKYSEEM